ncbi:DUF563 domain-containing protein [Caulobacter sp. S45]|uniref:glycosyltransferase family 61 protein n=1 Tax=Caulobacter sp. S45 TaxID=1641861 RepID=UPI001575D24E|nr:glycosyltransferase 61 family protein [Caulobacter sp. S45]
MNDEREHRVELTGKVVSDYEVLAQYSYASSRQFRKFDWRPGRSCELAPLSVFQVEQALIGPFCIPFDLQRRLVFRNHFYEDGSWFPVDALVRRDTYQHLRRPGPKLQGPALLLGGAPDLNYFHWLLSWFARLAIVELLAPELLLDSSLPVLIDSRAQREPFLAHLGSFGVTGDRLVWIDPDQDYEVEDAFLVTLPSQNEYHPDVLRSLSARLIASVGANRRGRRRPRLWISREQLSPKRRVANMADLEGVLDSAGLERANLEHMSASEQIEMFAEAELVVGVHGAGLANMIFCPADCRLLIIEKPFNVFLGLARTFTVLAEACELRHEVLVADVDVQLDTDYNDMLNAHNQDVVIDPDQLAAALRRLI